MEDEKAVKVTIWFHFVFFHPFPRPRSEVFYSVLGNGWIYQPSELFLPNSHFPVCDLSCARAQAFPTSSLQSHEEQPHGHGAHVPRNGKRQGQRPSIKGHAVLLIKWSYTYRNHLWSRILGGSQSCLAELWQGLSLSTRVRGGSLESFHINSSPGCVRRGWAKFSKAIMKRLQPDLLCGLRSLSLQVLPQLRAFTGYWAWEATEQQQAPKATCILAFSAIVHPDLNSGSVLKLWKRRLLHHKCFEFNKLYGTDSVSLVCLKSLWGLLFSNRKMLFWCFSRKWSLRAGSGNFLNFSGQP